MSRTSGDEGAGADPYGADPYGTAALRRRVLDAWTASPARFREDANAEEDQALGGYRDRLVVELAQNAADAAERAGVPGRLRLVLDREVLRAANTGAPLDPAGVESLSTLRASAKRDTTGVGRFGVGFAAVLAVSDEPRIVSRDGAVGWSRAATRDTVAAEPALGGELDRRDGHVPVLRLPSPATGTPPEGYDTEVVLPLRDQDAYAVAHRLLGEAGAALLLALPALTEVVIEVDGVRRELRAERSADGAWAEVDDGGAVDRWRLLSASGVLDAALLADRPVEERARPAWRLTWAVSVDPAGRPRPLPAGVTAVVHAPTPSDEPLDLPALLLASFPLDPGRRHVASGPLTDLLVDRAARAYADLVAALPAGPELLDLVPGPVPAGPLDASVREAAIRELTRTPLLPVAEDDAVRVRPPDAVAVDAPASLVEVLAEVLPGLLPAGWAVQRTPLARLGVRRLALADVVDLLASLERPPSWWQRLYGALAGSDVDALGALPVPLADGRTVRGARGVLVPAPGLDLAPLAALGVRVLDAAAAHPLLLRLGAVEGTPRALLDDPHVRAAVAHSYDADDPDAVADAVLPVVRAAQVEPDEEPWLGALALRDEDGEVRPANELLLPETPLAVVVSADAPFGLVAADLLERWGGDTLERAGVLATFAVVRDEDVPLDAGCDHDLDAEDDWVAATTVSAGLDQDAELPAVVAEFAALRDLDLVAPDRWDQALVLLREPVLWSVLTEPVAVLTPSGHRVLLPSYTAWWLRTRPVLGGRRPVDVRSGDPLLAGLYDPPPAGTDPDLLRALGVRSGVAGLLAEPGGPAELLDRLADPARVVGAPALGGLYAALADVPPDRVEPPAALRVPDATASRVVDAADAVVLDAPDLVPLLGSHPYVGVRHDRVEALAAVLDLPLAADLVPGRVESTGDPEPVPAAVRDLLPTAPETYLLHDPLVVDGVEVEWRYAAGELHAASAVGLARGLAWAAGRWDVRHLLAAVLGDPATVPALLAEAALDTPAR